MGGIIRVRVHGGGHDGRGEDVFDGDDFDGAESSRTWATAFAAVAVAMHACTPGVGAFAASGGAALDAAVFVVGRACIDPDGGFDASAVWLAFAGSYASALHLNDLVTFARRAAARRSSRWCTKKRVVVREGRAANDHWRLEDYVIDPIGFEVRAAKAKFKDRHRFKPMAYDASTNDPPRVIEKLTCRAKNCCREVDEQNLMAASVALCPEHFTSKKPFEYGSLTCAALFCLMCRRVHAPPLVPRMHVVLWSRRCEGHDQIAKNSLCSGRDRRK